MNQEPSMSSIASNANEMKSSVSTKTIGMDTEASSSSMDTKESRNALRGMVETSDPSNSVQQQHSSRTSNFSSSAPTVRSLLTCTIRKNQSESMVSPTSSTTSITSSDSIPARVQSAISKIKRAIQDNSYLQLSADLLPIKRTCPADQSQSTIKGSGTIVNRRDRSKSIGGSSNWPFTPDRSAIYKVQQALKRAGNNQIFNNLTLTSCNDDQVDLCVICGDIASGRHYGVISCEGCKGFFKRSLKKTTGYTCSGGNKTCQITPSFRNNCQYCRLKKCFDCGMSIHGIRARSVLPRTIELNQKLASMETTRNNPGSSSEEDGPTEKDIGSSRSEVVTIPRAPFVLVFDGDTSHEKNQDTSGNGNSGDSTGTNLNDIDNTPGTSDQSNWHPEHGNTEKWRIEQQHSQHLMASGGIRVKTELDNEKDDEEDLTEDGPLLTDESASFDLPAPSPLPPILNRHYTCETASRLLLLSIHWLKSIGQLNVKSDVFNETVLKDRWCEIFALGLLQCSSQFCLSNMLTAMAEHFATSRTTGQLHSDEHKAVQNQICQLEALQRLSKKLNISNLEFGYLKIIVFTATDSIDTCDSDQFCLIRQRACDELLELCTSDSSNTDQGRKNSPAQTSQSENDASNYVSKFSSGYRRYSELLLILPTLRSLDKHILMELFFSGLTGNVQIENIIPVILKTDVPQVLGQRLSVREWRRSPDGMRLATNDQKGM